MAGREMPAETIRRSEAVTYEPVKAVEYIDWNSVLAGSVIFVAVSLVLHAFGSAVGLAVVSPWSWAQNPSALTFGIAAAAYSALAQIYAYAMGGYLAARMRPVAGDAVPSEVQFRDSINGLTVWALGLIVSVLVIASVSWTVILASARVAEAGAVSGAVSASQSAGSTRDYAIDFLLRGSASPSDDAARAQPANTPGDVTGNDPGTARREIASILAYSATRGGVSPGDRDYLAQVVDARTGMGPEKARERVNTALNQLDQSVKSAADSARKVAAFGGFWTAIVLMLGAIAACWAASLGGQHRDQKRIA